MNAIQQNKLEAYDALDVLFDAHPAETDAIPAFTTHATAFKAQLGALRTLAATQAQPLRPSMDERDEAVNTAIAFGLKVAGIALCYATANQQPALESRVRVTQGDFNLLRIARRVQLVQQIHDAITPVVADLADHGITPATLTDLQATIDAAQVAVSAPRRTTGQKSAATAQLKATFTSVKDLLSNRIDPLLRPLQQANPEFYARYHSARSVVDRRGSRRSRIANETPTSPTTPLPAAS